MTEDVLDAVQSTLAQRPDLDSTNVALFGVSAGAFFALSSILKSPANFKCAITVNGIFSLPLAFEEHGPPIDQMYVRRSLGDDLVNKSIMTYIDRISHPILVIVGRQDRNVSCHHSLRFIRGLRFKSKSKQFEEIVFPEESHDLTHAPNLLHAYSSIDAFLFKHLASKGSPEPYSLAQKSSFYFYHSFHHFTWIFRRLFGKAI